MTDSSPECPRRLRRLKRVCLSILALSLLIGAGTYLWTHSLLNKAARIEIGYSREDVQSILGHPVVIETVSIRDQNNGGAPREYITESYDPTIAVKARINLLCEPLGWVPFDLHRKEWPVRLHFDGNDCVDMIQRGDEIIRK